MDFIRPLRGIAITEGVAILACLGYFWAFLRGGLPLNLCMELKLTVALTLCYAAGVPFSIWRGNSFDGLTGWLKTLLVFFLISQLVTTMGRVRKLLWVIILSMGAVAFYSLAIKGVGATAEDARVLRFTMGILSGNYVGIAVGTTLPFIAALFIRRGSSFALLPLVSIFAMLVWMVALTASRAGTLGVVLSLVLTWVYLLRDSFKARLMGAGFVLVLIFVGVFAPGIFWDRLSTLWDPTGYAKSEASASEYQRKALLRRSITYTLQNPLFGVGLQNFEIMSGSSTGSAHEWKGTHNTFTQVSSEAGIPAFIFFVAIFGVAIRRLNEIKRWAGKDLSRQEVGVFVRASLVSIFAFIFSGFFAHLAYDFYLFYLVGIGVALQAVQRQMQMQAMAEPAVAARPRYSNGWRARAS